MELGLYLDRINDEFITYFGEDNLPTEEELLDKLKKGLKYPPDSIKPAYEDLILEKIKIKLEERYPYKKFSKTKNKLFELDKYGRKIKDIVYLREYIELTSFLYSNFNFKLIKT